MLEHLKNFLELRAELEAVMADLKSFESLFPYEQIYVLRQAEQVIQAIDTFKEAVNLTTNQNIAI